MSSIESNSLPIMKQPIPKTSVNINNSYPSEVFSISSLSKVFTKAIAEHFYTKFIYKTNGTYGTLSRGQQGYIDYMIAKLLKPYYPESVSTYDVKTGSDSKRTYYNITGNTFVVPLKKYIRGLYVIIYIDDSTMDAGDCFTITRSYTLTFIGNGHNVFANKFNDTLCKYTRGEFNIRPETEVEMTIINNEESFEYQSIVRRSMQSVLMPDDVKQSCLELLRKFKHKSTNKFYHQIEEPYHYNMLLYGKPGTGKTSFVHALSNELKFPLVKLSGEYLSAYATSHFESDRLSLVASSFSRSIIFIDEVDLYTYNRETTDTSDESDQKRILLSDLLEFLDKIGNGNVVILCTNHIDRLDPALIRNGRINRKVKFDYWDQTCLDKKLKQAKITFEEMDNFAKSHNIEYRKDDNRYYPSVVSDICKEISLQRFWETHK